MDNPDFLKIIETIPASHKLSITTSYPDVTDVYNKLITLIKFCRSRKIGLRISVREENYERLVRDGLLTITEKQNGEKYLCPVKKLWPLGLSFVYRFAEEKTKNGLIIRDYDQKHDGLTKVGRNVEGAGKMHTKIGGSEVVLSPTGFWNFLLVRIQNELTYRLHKKSAGMDHLPAKITDHFSNLTNLSELIGGKTEISVHDILRHGILKRHESDLEQQSEQKVPGYDNEDLRAFYMGSVTEGHNGVEEISIQVIYQVVPEVAPRVVKIRVANMRQKTYEEKIFPPSPSTSTFAS